MGRLLRTLVLATAIAGAMATTASAVTVTPYQAVADDGTILRGHQYLPDGAGPYGTVLEYSPYYNHPVYGSSADMAGDTLVETLLDANFAVVIVNMRGTGDSDGCNAIGGPGDIADVRAVIEQVAAQPWSNGNVGMIGHSYSAWTQDMAAVAAPPALKAIIPTSGVIDLWSLLTRRGAPLAAGLGVFFAPAWTALTLGDDPTALGHLCTDLPSHYYENAQTATSGDRTPWFEARDLRQEIAGTPVPMLRSNGLLPVGEGHILQVEGLWDSLKADRSHMILGQWNHETPASAPELGWYEDVVGWFDHYLRGGPQTVPTGVVEFQDDSGAWNTANRWPPKSRATRVHLSGSSVTWDGAPLTPATAVFQSGDTDPGLGVEGQDPRIAASVCGPHQALYVSPPVSEEALVAGNFTVDVSITSTLPGGNFSVYLWKTAGDGSCPDQEAAVFGRAPLDLRHWAESGRSRDFPVLTPTRVQITSEPLASRIRPGERIVVAIGGGNVELTPDPLHPAITVHSGSIDLPVHRGELRFEGQPKKIL